MRLVAHKAERGFTLLEAGVVIGVAAILMTIIATSATARINNARNDRVALELQGFARSGATAWLRGIQIDQGPPMAFKYQEMNGLTPGPLDTLPDIGTGTCFDLSMAGSKFCDPAGTIAGSNPWGGATAPDSNILNAFAGGPPNNGYNPYCGSYEICMYSHRVEARTCVPQSAKEQASATGSVCSFACQQLPNNTEPLACIVSSISPRSIASTRTKFTVSDTWTNLSSTDHMLLFGYK
jgi:type II secretory pathway pseudopilin PulG